MEINKVYNIDCFDLLSQLADSTVDLIILDPDYQNWDYLIERGIIEKCLNKLKNSGNILIFTKKPYDFNVRKKIDLFYKNEIIWKYSKTGNWVSNNLPTYSYQKIFWCCKNDNYFNPRTGIPYSKYTKQGNKGYLVFDGYRQKSKPFYNNKDGIWINDVLIIDRKRENDGKIPSKPLELCQILIRCFCPENGLVLDPFMGGGNMIYTSKKEKRNYIGTDINVDCFKIAEKKLINADLELF